MTIQHSTNEITLTNDAGHEPGSSLWRNRDFLLLWSGQAVSTLGSSFSDLALPLLVLAMTGSPVQAGFIYTAQRLPFLVLSLPAGALIDRWNRKTVMIWCDALRCLAFGAVPLAYFFHVLTVWQIYVVVLLQGTALVFFNIAQIASLPRVVPEQHLAQANSLNEGVRSGTALLGPGLAGLVLSLARNTIIGSVLAFLIDSISYLISVIALQMVRTPFQTQQVTMVKRSLLMEIWEGLRFLWAQSRLRVMALLGMSVNFLTYPVYLAVIVLAGPQGFHASPSIIGLIFSIASIGGILSSFIAPAISARFRFGHIIISMVIMMALVVPLLATAISPLMLIVGWGLLEFTVPIYNVALVSYRLSLIPDKLQGRVNSSYRLLNYAGMPLGSFIVGFLLVLIGARSTLWIIAAGLAICALGASLTELRKG